MHIREVMKLNIGCGRDYRKGWINIDISRSVKAEAWIDIRKNELVAAHDARERIPSDSVEEIYLSGVLEQIGSNDELIFAMNEMHRVLKPGGKLTVIVPNGRYAIAHRDPMDVRKFTPETFAYFDKGCNEYDLYGKVYGFQPWLVANVHENNRHILTVTMTK